MPGLCIVCEAYHDDEKRVIYETMKELLGVVVLKMCFALSSFLISFFHASSVSV